MSDVWDIRDDIQVLEDVKDEIIEFLSSRTDLDDNNIKMWINDVKECYFSIVAAWEMLSSVSKGKHEFAGTCKSYLITAKSHYAQAASELRAFNEEYSNELEDDLIVGFENCHDSILSELKKLLPQEVLKTPDKRVVKISNTEYELPCSVCSKTCISFKIGTTRLFKEEGLLYSGITHQTSRDLKYADAIFKFLDEEKISELHSFLENNHLLEEGLDAYCPQCDAIYCWEHFNAYEEFDDGFYDCTYAECPKGHHRMIDD